MLKSINMQVLQLKSNRDNYQGSISKEQDQYAFFKMLEDFSKEALSSSKNYMLLLAVRQFMHKSFISVPYQRAVHKSLENFVEKAQIEDKALLQVLLKLIDEKIQGVKKNLKSVKDEIKAEQIEEV